MQLNYCRANMARFAFFGRIHAEKSRRGALERALPYFSRKEGNMNEYRIYSVDGCSAVEIYRGLNETDAKRVQAEMYEFRRTILIIIPLSYSSEEAISAWNAARYKK